MLRLLILLWSPWFSLFQIACHMVRIIICGLSDLLPPHSITHFFPNVLSVCPCLWFWLRPMLRDFPGNAGFGGEELRIPFTWWYQHIQCFIHKFLALISVLYWGAKGSISQGKTEGYWEPEMATYGWFWRPLGKLWEKTLEITLQMSWEILSFAWSRWWFTFLLGTDAILQDWLFVW